MVDQQQLHRVQPRIRSVMGLADHRMKILRYARAKHWNHILRQRSRAEKLCFEAFRAATTARQQFQDKVETVLTAFDVPAPPSSQIIVSDSSALEGWQETNEGTAHFYTDGSFIPATSTQSALCGSGVQLWFRGNSFDACRPLLQHTVHSRLSSNVAELDALLLALTWVQQHQAHVQPVVIHYDSEYAMHVSTGQWRALRNIALVGKLKQIIAAIQPVVRIHWRWIRGHTNHAGNDAADKLANLGAQGQTLTLPIFVLQQGVLGRHKLTSKTCMRSTSSASQNLILLIQSRQTYLPLMLLGMRCLSCWLMLPRQLLVLVDIHSCGLRILRQIRPNCCSCNKESLTPMSNCLKLPP